MVTSSGCRRQAGESWAGLAGLGWLGWAGLGGKMVMALLNCCSPALAGTRGPRVTSAGTRPPRYINTELRVSGVERQQVPQHIALLAARARHPPPHLVVHVAAPQHSQPLAARDAQLVDARGAVAGGGEDEARVDGEPDHSSALSSLHL